MYQVIILCVTGSRLCDFKSVGASNRRKKENSKKTWLHDLWWVNKNKKVRRNFGWLFVATPLSSIGTQNLCLPWSPSAKCIPSLRHCFIHLYTQNHIITITAFIWLIPQKSSSAWSLHSSSITQQAALSGVSAITWYKSMLRQSVQESCSSHYLIQVHADTVCARILDR